MDRQEMTAHQKEEVQTGREVEFGELPELETKRLVLRRMMLADAGFYLRRFSDPDIVELAALDAPENIDRARQELPMQLDGEHKNSV